MRVLEEDKNDKYNFNIDSVYFFVLCWVRLILSGNW